MKPQSFNSRLPNIDIDYLLKGECPKLVPHIQGKRIPSKATLEYLIWNYLHHTVGIKKLTKMLGVGNASGTGTCIGWLKKYEVYDGRCVQHPNFIRDERFARVAYKLHKQGLNLTEIAHELSCNPSSVTKQAKIDGWYVPQVRSMKWKIKGRFPASQIPTYKKYCHTVRHVTNKIYSQYQSVLDPKGLRSHDHHLDHKLSVYDAFNKGDLPLPWQMICHPANLKITSSSKNSGKGKHSTLGPTSLKQAIAAFEQTHGRVRLPVIAGSNKAGRFVYNKGRPDTVRNRIKKDSEISVGDLRRLWTKGCNKPRFSKRSHLKSKHYEYICFCYISGITQKHIAELLGCNTTLVGKAIRRMGLTSIQNIRNLSSKVLLLKSKGMSLHETAEQLAISTKEVLCIYYLSKKDQK